MKIALGLDYRLLQTAKQLPEITYIYAPKTTGKITLFVETNHLYQGLDNGNEIQKLHSTICNMYCLLSMAPKVFQLWL